MFCYNSRISRYSVNDTEENITSGISITCKFYTPMLYTERIDV